MPVYEQEESTWAGPIPEDTILAARVTGVAEKEKNFGEKTQMRVEFAFMVDDPDSAHDGQKLWGDTPARFISHPDCKLRSWAAEVLGVDGFPDKFKLDTDDLVNESCRVVVGSYETTKDGEVKTRNFVKDVLRASAKMGLGSSIDSEDEPF